MGGGRLEVPFTVGSESGGVAGSGLDCIEESGDGPAVADDVLGGGGGRGLLPDGPDGGNLDGGGGPGLAVSGTGGGLIDGGFLDGGGGWGAALN